MSYNLVDPTTGDLTQVAGRGRAEYGASTVRQGTIEIPGQAAQSFQTLSVTFTTPMPDANYQVTFKNRYGSSDVLNIEWQTKNGFSFFVYNASTSATGTHGLDYTAFKLYSDIEYSNIVNSIPAGTSQNNPLVNQNDLSVIGTRYESDDVTVTETAWASKTFTFTNLPKGRYLQAMRMEVSGVYADYCNCLDLGMQQFVNTGYGSVVLWVSPWTVTQATTGSKTITYNLCNTGSVTVKYRMVLIRLL